MLRFGASLRLPAFNPRFFGLAKHLRLQRRPYAKVGGKSNAKSESLVRRPAKKDIDPDAVWVDPFKSPPPPKPDLRVLIRPAIFTAIVILSADYIADRFVERRTSQIKTRAERKSETLWTIGPIIGVNVAVFGLWRYFPSTLYKYGAILVPYAPTPLQLVVNTFSHQEFWHLVFNQWVMYSFGSLVCDTIGREHFLALYLQAACFSSLASVAAVQILVSRRVFDSSSLTRGSLGASGVLYSMLGICAIINPDMGVSLLFVPYYVPIKFIFPGLCTLDMVGIIARWSRFDHVAHVWPGYSFSLIHIVGWCYFWGGLCIWNNKAANA